jgi:hypothetical protein
MITKLINQLMPEWAAELYIVATVAVQSINYLVNA